MKKTETIHPAHGFTAPPHQELWIGRDYGGSLPLEEVKRRLRACHDHMRRVVLEAIWPKGREER